MRTTKAVNRRMTQLWQQLDQAETPEQQKPKRNADTEAGAVVAMRLPPQLLAEIDRLIPLLRSGPFANHVTVRRSDVLRLLVTEGLTAVRNRVKTRQAL
jgi:hypothetical protein